MSTVEERVAANPPHLDQWGFANLYRLYCLPTEPWVRLVGEVSNDAERGRFYDGARIYTSQVHPQKDLDLEAGWVRTASGMLYTLGDVSPDFLKWMDEHNVALSDYLSK